MLDDLPIDKLEAHESLLAAVLRCTRIMLVLGISASWTKSKPSRATSPHSKLNVFSLWFDGMASVVFPVPAAPH